MTLHWLKIKYIFKSQLPPWCLDKASKPSSEGHLMSHISDHQKARRSCLVTHHCQGKGLWRHGVPGCRMFLIRQVLLVFSWHLLFPGACFKSAVGKLTASPFSNANGDARRASSLHKRASAAVCRCPFKGYFEGNRNTRVSLRRDAGETPSFLHRVGICF